MAEWGGEENVSEDEESGEEEESSSLDHVICLVDSRARMFEPSASGGTPFSLALQCVERVLRARVIASDRNMTGVVLYGTANKSSLDSPHDHVFELIPLDVPSAQVIPRRLFSRLIPAGSFHRRHFLD